MDKVLLLSVVWANVALPAFFAADPSPRRGLSRAIATVVAFDVLYLIALLFIFPVLVQ